MDNTGDAPRAANGAGTSIDPEAPSGKRIAGWMEWPALVPERKRVHGRRKTMPPSGDQARDMSVSREIIGAVSCERLRGQVLCGLLHAIEGEPDTMSLRQSGRDRRIVKPDEHLPQLQEIARIGADAAKG